MASKHEGRRLRRPKFSTVIALFALFAVLGGSAFAAKKVINGKDIKKNTVTSKAVKNGTLKTKDLSSKAQDDLQGQQGPKGEQGEQGEPGTNGANGVIDPLTVSAGNQAILPDGIAQPAILTLGGLTGGTTYVVNAKAQVGAGTADEVECTISRNSTVIDTALYDSAGDFSGTSVAFQAVVGGAGTEIVMGCEATNGGGTVTTRKITAIPVG